MKGNKNDCFNLYAFISSDGNFYYLTDTRCPFEPNDVVYVMDCHC